jgi:hypothetical protein
LFFWGIILSIVFDLGVFLIFFVVGRWFFFGFRLNLSWCLGRFRDFINLLITVFLNNVDNLFNNIRDFFLFFSGLRFSNNSLNLDLNWICRSSNGSSSLCRRSLLLGRLLGC